MATQTNQTPFWQKDRESSLQARVDQIHKYRDPRTSADEVLRIADGMLWVSLLFTGALGWFSYQLFLSRFLPPYFAEVAALLVMILIEIGKRSLSQYSLRLPFLNGFGYIFHTVETTSQWIGITLFASVVFGMSVYNSTRGAYMYAGFSATQKTEKTFAADTRDIDAQIAATENRMKGYQDTRYKGTVTYPSQQALRTEARSLEKLQAQRETRIQQQRADFERQRSQSDAANENSAHTVLAIGGFLEILQFILLFIKASCEKILEGRMKQNAAQQEQGIGFRKQQSPTPAWSESGPNIQSEHEPTAKRPIGFRFYDEPAVADTAPHSAHTYAIPMPYQNADTAANYAIAPDEVLKHYLSELRKEPANYRDKNAKHETVSRRIHDKLNKALIAVKAAGEDSFSRSVAQNFTVYLNSSIVPLLDHYQAPWANMKELNDLVDFKTKQV